MSSLGWSLSDNEGNSVRNDNYETFKLSSDQAQKLAEALSKLPALKKEYGSYSALAVRKMLMFMRVGKYWSHPQSIVSRLKEESAKEVKLKIKKRRKDFYIR
ncbi:hypothetical protein [Melioribacter roseus]|uniref:hypothetical protein n=1 Tax=Melioribacter roseus TaxID=1134405 RepID=UPI00031FF64B|nr:hypothetical protein [Melioribacter roseus]